MSKPAYYTAEMVRALPEDGNRYETVHGELLVTPAPPPWHQEIVERLNIALRLYLERERVGHLFASPADISWDDDILVQPDLFVVPLGEARTLDWSKMRSLLIAIEVLSPSTSFAKSKSRHSSSLPEVQPPTPGFHDRDAAHRAADNHQHRLHVVRKPETPFHHPTVWQTFAASNTESSTTPVGPGVPPAGRPPKSRAAAGGGVTSASEPG